jgi:hypothetical protein
MNLKTLVTYLRARFIGTSWAYIRGTRAVYRFKRWRWAEPPYEYIPVDLVKLPCTRCGRPPTREGYDACVGHVEGATSVCCGHGVEPPIIMGEGPDVELLAEEWGVPVEQPTERPTVWYEE